MEKILLKPIGVIRSENTDPLETPIQPIYAEGVKGYAEIFPQFREGLKDLEGFSHLYLIYYFHEESSVKLMVKPFLDEIERGVFSTRAPCRPNKIGLSVVKLYKIEGNILYLDNVDILDGTPLLDIKPYISRFDKIEKCRSGWQENIDEKKAKIIGRRKK